MGRRSRSDDYSCGAASAAGACRGPLPDVRRLDRHGTSRHVLGAGTVYEPSLPEIRGSTTDQGRVMLYFMRRSPVIDDTTTGPHITRGYLEMPDKYTSSPGRFWSRVDTSGGPCWQWLGKLCNGYGRIRHLGSPDYAHRMSYRLHKGDIPAGLEIDHICRNRGCVNPDHLEAVPHRVNALRGEGYYAKQAQRAELTLPPVRVRKLPRDVCKRGHSLSTESGNLYTYRNKYGAGRACRACQRELRRQRSA